MGQNVYADPKLQAAYEKGLKVGRVEGMIAYQKHLIENLQKENAVLVKRLEAERKSQNIYILRGKQAVGSMHGSPTLQQK